MLAKHKDYIYDEALASQYCRCCRLLFKDLVLSVHLPQTAEYVRSFLALVGSLLNVLIRIPPAVPATATNVENENRLNSPNHR